MNKNNQIQLSKEVTLDLPKLLESRLLIQANSGGGKSYILRKILEESHGKVQQIVLDIEGEFASLREKYDYLLVGADGDIPIDVRSAGLLARKLLELNVSAIIDLSELKMHQRIQFVKKFLETLIDLPKNLWHPLMVIVDEAHIFTPENGKAESSNAVIDLQTRGRKRGFCGILATQRLSKLNKDAVAECNNKLIGRCGLDIDMKRAGNELGFTAKHQEQELRHLEAGEFFIFGPATSNKQKSIVNPIRFQANRVKTTHPEPGSRKLISTPPATSKIKAMLSKLVELPQEAEKELIQIDDFKKEITKLRNENTRLKHTDYEKEKVRVKEIAFKEGYLKGKSEVPAAIVQSSDTSLPSQAEKVLEQIVKILSKHQEISVQPQKVQPLSPLKTYEVKPINIKKGSGISRIHKAIAMFYPEFVTKPRIGTIAGLSYKSGSFATYLSSLRNAGFIQGEGSQYKCTQLGIEQVGEFESLPKDSESLVNFWAGIIKGSPGRMLLALAAEYPRKLTKEELGTQTGLVSTSGSFATYLSILRRNDLIIVDSEGITISKELMGN